MYRSNTIHRCVQCLEREHETPKSPIIIESFQSCPKSKIWRYCTEIITEDGRGGGGSQNWAPPELQSLDTDILYIIPGKKKMILL